LVLLAKEHHCGLVVEDLEFSRMKAYLKKLGKKHAQRLSAFAYAKFFEILSGACAREGVLLQKNQQMWVATTYRPTFVLRELFTLGAVSNGINPLTQNLTLQIGTFSVTIPPGSFKQITMRIYVFQVVINGVDLRVQILALSNTIYALAAEGKNVNLSGLTNPVTVVLTIGNNRGSTVATAQFR
jgi:hypothetical protein